jgi:hypothetical protein
MGKNIATYQRTHVQSGYPTTNRLRRIKYNPNVDYDEKLISSSDRDYQSHEKRKNLMVTSGFHEKGFTFLMEDTYFTFNDYLKLYNQHDKIKNTLESSKTKIDLYACIYKTKNRFRFMNKFDFYNVSMRLHLVKLLDQNKDVRELIDDITNNKSSNSLANETIFQAAKEKATTILNRTLNKPKGEKELNEKEKTKAIETTIKDLLDSVKSYKPSLKYGKLLEDDQYSDPDTKDTKNRITTNFRTSLKCQLSDSIRFRDEARIVHTWERTLTPGSIWEFQMEHHLGKGIHLNQFYDFDMKNQNHPSRYFFILEYVGDRKARLVRNIDKDFFQGYSPTKIHMKIESI